MRSRVGGIQCTLKGAAAARGLASLVAEMPPAAEACHGFSMSEDHATVNERQDLLARAPWKPYLVGKTRLRRSRKILKASLLLVGMAILVLALSSYVHIFKLPDIEMTSNIRVENCCLCKAWLSTDIRVRRPHDWYVDGVLIRGAQPYSVPQRTPHWNSGVLRWNSTGFCFRWPDETHSLELITVHSFQANVWLLVVVLGVFGCVCEVGPRIWRRRTREQGCCVCGYDLRGNVSGVCPECGKPIPEVVRKELAEKEANTEATR